MSTRSTGWWKRRWRGSLALRISLLAVAVAVLTALIGGLIAVNSIDQATESGARQSLARLASELQSDADTTPERTLVRLRALKIDSGFIGLRGRITATSSQAKGALTAAQVQDVLAGQSVSAVQEVDGQETLVEARPLTDGGGIFVVEPKAEAVAAGTEAIRRLLLAIAIACAVAVALGLLVSWRLARPIKRTAAAAHQLAEGRRDVVLPAYGPTEVAEVASALGLLGDNLARSESRQRDFLLSVSHDLRTPLTAISGYSESLADGVIEPSQVPQVGSVIFGEAQRLERFVADLLDLARLDASEVRIDSTDVDLAALVSETASVWSARCDREGVVFRAEVPAGPIVVRTDPVRARQILDGLLENALRVVPSGQPIILATRMEYGGSMPAALLEVRDGGPGLSDDDLPVAFQRSVLYNRYRGVRKVGTGLGLAIVHQLVSRLGGAVEAGHAVEGGARFTVRLPPSGASLPASGAGLPPMRAG